MTKRMTPQQVKRMGELREKGMSYAAIGKEVGCSEATVRHWINPGMREWRQLYNAKYYAEHREELLERATKYHAKYYAEHKEPRRQYGVRYRAEHKEYIAQRDARYYAEHKEEILRRQAMKYVEDIQWKLRSALRGRLRRALQGNYKSGSAVRDLGCSIAYLKRYLESKFEPGMTWDNWATNGWHIDHIKPLAFFDLTDGAQLLEACHYTNLQPLWAEDNRHKHAKMPEEISVLL